MIIARIRRTEDKTFTLSSAASSHRRGSRAKRIPFVLTTVWRTRPLLDTCRMTSPKWGWMVGSPPDSITTSAVPPSARVTASSMASISSSDACPPCGLAAKHAGHSRLQA